MEEDAEEEILTVELRGTNIFLLILCIANETM
jgi:hypothetical protein